MWPYACLSDCKVMVKCVESDGKVIATHVSVQSHCQPVRPDRERVAVTHHVSHACDSAKLPIGSIRCQRCWVGGLGCFIRCHRLPLLEPSCVVTVHAGVLIMSFDLTAMQPSCSLHGRVIRVCPIARMYASVTVLGRLGRWDRFHSLPPAATPGTFMCCHAAFMGVSFVCVLSPGCTRV